MLTTKIAHRRNLFLLSQDFQNVTNCRASHLSPVPLNINPCTHRPENHRACNNRRINLDLRDGWGEAFSTAINARTLVIRKGLLGAGQTYTFSLSATDASGLAGYAGTQVYALDTNIEEREREPSGILKS